MATRYQHQHTTADSWRGMPGMLLVASNVLLAVVPAVAWVLARRLM